MRVFIDSNIPMYVAGSPHPHRERASQILEKANRNQIEACTSTEVLQEILWRYTALKRYDLASQVYSLFIQVCPEVFPVTLSDTDKALGILMSVKQLSSRDAIHAAVMLNHGISIIATFDKDFDAIEGIKRFEMDT